MPRTDNIHWMETKQASHVIYKDIVNAELNVFQAKESVNGERWEDAEAHIENAIQLLLGAREKILAVCEKHGTPD